MVVVCRIMVLGGRRCVGFNFYWVAFMGICRKVEDVNVGAGVRSKSL